MNYGAQPYPPPNMVSAPQMPAPMPAVPAQMPAVPAQGMARSLSNGWKKFNVGDAVKSAKDAYKLEQNTWLANNPGPTPFEEMTKKQLRNEVQYDEYRSPENQVRYLKAWLSKYWTGNPYSRSEKARTRARAKAKVWGERMQQEATLMRKYLGFSMSWTEIAVLVAGLYVGLKVLDVNRLMNATQKVKEELQKYDCLGDDGPTRNSACAGVIELRDELIARADASALARWAVGLADTFDVYNPIAKPDELPPEGKRFWDAVVGQWVA